jgi:hypothetical protein
VSFRLVPRYRVEIGTADIVVMAHVTATIRQRVIGAIGGLLRVTARRIVGAAAVLRPRMMPPPRTAEPYAFAGAPLSSPSTLASGQGLSRISTPAMINCPGHAGAWRTDECCKRPLCSVPVAGLGCALRGGFGVFHNFRRPVWRRWRSSTLLAQR